MTTIQKKSFIELIRALFPFWNFFDQTAFTFDLFVKTSANSGWTPISFFQDRRKSSPFININVNESLAQFNIVEHFAHDIQQLEKINVTDLNAEAQNLTSYHLLTSLVQEKLRSFGTSYDSYEFKITANDGKQFIDLFSSPTLTRENL
jgi:hypothetical protein